MRPPKNETPRSCSVCPKIVPTFPRRRTRASISFSRSAVAYSQNETLTIPSPVATSANRSRVRDVSDDSHVRWTTPSISMKSQSCRPVSNAECGMRRAAGSGARPSFRIFSGRTFGANPPRSVCPSTSIRSPLRRSFHAGIPLVSGGLTTNWPYSPSWMIRLFLATSSKWVTVPVRRTGYPRAPRSCDSARMALIFVSTGNSPGPACGRAAPRNINSSAIDETRRLRMFVLAGGLRVARGPPCGFLAAGGRGLPEGCMGTWGGGIVAYSSLACLGLERSSDPDPQEIQTHGRNGIWKLKRGLKAK
jgi:hypothetical protein